MSHPERAILSAAVLTLALGACNKTLTVDGGSGGTTTGGTSSGGSGGSGGNSTGGSAPTSSGTGGAPAYDPWTGNAADCPAQAPNQLETCSVAEGEICAYWWKEPSSAENEYRACGCWEAATGVTKWDCYANFGGFSECSTTEPAQDSSCFGHVGVTCNYPPQTECYCPSEGADSKWNCTDNGMHVGNPPGTVDATKLVKDLTAAERQAWCDWNVPLGQPEGSPQPPETPLSADGYTTNTGAAFCSKFFCNACLPQIPVSYCTGNLSLSTCEAPVSELSDCVITLHDNWPYQHGCARYFEKPGCDGTILVTPDGSGGTGSDCSIDVQ